MSNLFKWSFLHSVGILVYIILVAFFINNGEKWFGDTDNFVGPVAFLLLFTLSAIVVGSLGLGKPVMLYLENKKKEAGIMILLTACWLLIFTMLALIISVVLK